MDEMYRDWRRKYKNKLTQIAEKSQDPSLALLLVELIMSIRDLADAL